MGLVVIIIGLLFAGLGFLEKAYPGTLVSGYRTLPPAEKKNVDIETLSAFLQKGLIGMGGAVVAGYYLLIWAGFLLAAQLSLIVISLGGLAGLSFGAQRFDHNPKKKSRFVAPVALVVIAFFVTGMFVYGYAPTKIRISDGTVRFSGMYGVEIRVDDIAGMEMAGTIPTIGMRTNGFALAGTAKGYFTVEGFGRCRLFLHAGYEGSYIVLTDKRGLRTIFNTKDDRQARDYFDRIRKWLP